MKTVIRHGNKIPTTYEFCCSNCECVFRMTKEDLQKEQQSLVYTLQTRCPECNEYISGARYIGCENPDGVYEFRCNKCNKYFYKSDGDISVPDMNNIIHSYCPYCNNVVESSKDRFIKLVNLDR